MYHLGYMNLEESGSIIRNARREAGLSQADLAKRLHMSRATLSQLENGVISELGVRKFARVCDVLGLEVIVQRRRSTYTLREAYAENKEEREAAFKETDLMLAQMGKDSGHG